MEESGGAAPQLVDLTAVTERTGKFQPQKRSGVDVHRDLACRLAVVVVADLVSVRSEVVRLERATSVGQAGRRAGALVFNRIEVEAGAFVIDAPRLEAAELYVPEALLADLAIHVIGVDLVAADFTDPGHHLTAGRHEPVVVRAET